MSLLGTSFLCVSAALGMLVMARTRLAGRSLLQILAAGTVVGIVAGTWVAFLLSLAMGFRPVCIAAATLGLAIACVALVDAAPPKRCVLQFRLWRVNARGVLPVALALLILVPFFLFGISRSFSGDWLYRGNFEDLSFHLSIASGFLEQRTFPPLNPQSASAPLLYHFMADFNLAIVGMGSADLYRAVTVLNVVFAGCLAILLARFFIQVLRDRLAASLGVLLFLAAHIGVANVLFAALGHPPEPLKHLSLASWHGFKDVLLFPFLNFLDPIINLFEPQRSFLLGFPLALVILSGLYTASSGRLDPVRTGILATLTGLMPLVHIHSFAFVAPCLVLVTLGSRHRERHTLLALTPLAIATPQLWFLLSHRTAQRFSGWDVNRLGGGLIELQVLGSPLLTRIAFWLRAGGPPLVLGIVAAGWWLWQTRRGLQTRHQVLLKVMLIVGLAFFVLINFYRASPNWGDSNKFFLYFYLALCIPAANLLADSLRAGWRRRAIASACFLACVLPMGVEAAGIFSRSASRLFSRNEAEVATWIRQNTSPDSVFLTSDSVAHFVTALAGRRVVDGAYTWNTGCQAPGIQEEIATFYETGGREFLRSHGVGYIVVSSRERQRYRVNRAALAVLPLVKHWEHPEGEIELFAASGEGGPTSHPSQNGAFLWLSQLKPQLATQTVGTVHFDSNFNGDPITLKRRRYDHGVGAHARSELLYAVPVGASEFVSDIGLDDSEAGSPGSVIFRVFVDDALRFESPVMRWATPTAQVRVDVRGARTIRLMVDDAGDGDTCDHASWADAHILLEVPTEATARKTLGPLRVRRVDHVPARDH